MPPFTPLTVPHPCISSKQTYGAREYRYITTDNTWLTRTMIENRGIRYEEDYDCFLVHLSSPSFLPLLAGGLALLRLGGSQPPPTSVFGGLTRLSRR